MPRYYVYYYLRYITPPCHDTILYEKRLVAVAAITVSYAPLEYIRYAAERAMMRLSAACHAAAS